jgi:serine/threonine protein kinase
VLEYYPAGSLLDTEYFLGSPIDEDTLGRIITDLLTALNAAHQESILHLDIKPANVLRDSAGGYVLTDFGISQGTLVSHHVLETGVGSPGYQAPEQREMNRRWIGPRTDLYGVGATAWSLYTGQRLDFQPKLVYASPGETGAALPPISRYRPCPPHLENLIMSLVAFYPDDRPGGAAEALANLNSSTGTRKRMLMKEQPIYQTGDPRLRPLIDNLVDPLWASICSTTRPKLNYVLFKDGEVLCEEGESAYHAYVLLSGSIKVQRGGLPPLEVSREGSFLGENAALTGQPRTATLMAKGETWCLLFNAAELEQFVVSHPAVAIRLIKTLAIRARMNHGLI